ncbi:penicillin-binding protein activator [Thermomonas sp. HDW16]|uniref:penicillin-binding protein activator n=1 Tax=Thermomonas sp. HDW16 TaxID=2714945 RepID=UPI00140A95C9|nr:penicillin-binding protein activator [Thermomonas sp. HDW16]QIL21458.1 ABC transporter substrate-binding protein [Thermomonas sp. HDW16]
MARKHPIGRSVQALSCALFLFVLGGCASVEVQKPAATTARNQVIVEAQALAQAHAGLSGQARTDNAVRIEALLAQLDDATLSREAGALPVGDPLYNFAGRALANRGLPLPRPFDRGDWNFDAAGRPPADRDGYRPPMKVAVLLPLSGSQAAVAAAVRDGFLTGYYGETRRKPDVRFYDTAGGANAAYGRAVADGNDFVAGPLAREEVDAVFADDTPQVPLLALNRGNRTPPAGSASFSLSPEDEGISIAQYLVERGAKRVLIVNGGEDAQRRSASAAKAQLERRGVQVAGSVGTGADLAPLAQGVDAVLLAMKGPQARALMPQLAMAGITATTRVATSQITSGTGKASEDAALDGIVYPTETWGTRNVPGLPSQASAAARLDTAKGPAARLFAFGYDAWLVTAYLERLALSANADIAGATGRLSLDGFGNVLRQPSWSRYSGGVPVPLGDGAR